MKMDTLWYKDGELNICYLALDKHIEDGYGDQIALIYDSPVTQTVKKIFLEVKTEVAKLLRNAVFGIKKKYSRNLYAYDSPSSCYACMCKN
jgi:propionyl-CoA synthetase